LKKLICSICGREFEGRASNAKYCSHECMKEGARISNRNRKRYRSQARKDLKVERVRYTTSSIAEIAKMAAEAGMSYGQFVAKEGK